MNRLFILFAVCILTGCQFRDLAPQAEPAEHLMVQDDWVGAMRHYREALKSDPDDASLRRGYHVVAERAAAHYITQSRKSEKVHNYASAEAILGHGLAAVPESVELRDELARVRQARLARELFNDAVAADRLGHQENAKLKLEEALTIAPQFEDALLLFDRLSDEEAALAEEIRPIRLLTAAPVTINFKNAKFKDALLALGQTYGVNLIFDSGIEDSPVTIFAEDVEFQQAFNLILKSNRAFYRRLGSNSVIIAPDTAEGRAEYEDYLVRTFYLNSARAADMASLLTTTLGLKNVSVNESANAVTARDSRERLILASRLVASNDRAEAEVVMEVEILEVNRTKSEQLGIDFGSQINLSAPEFLLGDFASASLLLGAIEVSSLSLPALTLRYFKQDVDAKTLASPRIRTIDKQEARIHIGDRVPLRASTIQDATGQTRTTFNYQDIGIKLTVTPEVKLNRKIKVDLELEVSSLGNNLGTAQEPAFSIGTRNLATSMVLSDSESAVIGGLIRDEERDTVQKVPGLGDMPRLGRVFRSRDGQGTRTDILLTLTPRIVRGRDVPARSEAEISSGSGNQVGIGTAVDFLAAKSDASLPSIRIDLGEADSGSASMRTPVIARHQQAAGSISGPSLGFSGTELRIKSNEILVVDVFASDFDEKISGTATIRFRPDLLEAQSVNVGADVKYRIDNELGQVEIELDDSMAGGRKKIATISFKGLKQGLSFLFFANSFGAGDKMPSDIQLQASRIAVH